jgi:quinoprotein glucose dehydrogenase
VVALDSRTGRLVWGYQPVYRDLWDYDTAAAPLVTSMLVKGLETPVVIAGNKTGMLYVLNPATGKPILPIEERAVPKSNVPGEITSATQPLPTTVPALVRQSLDAAEAWGLNETDRKACQAAMANTRGASIFTPPSESVGLEVPGVFGGINWSGFAWDAKHQRLIVAVTNLPFKVQLIQADQFSAGNRGDFRGEASPQRGAPYAVARTAFVHGTPCVPPPWGEVVAVDLADGKIAWHQPVGSMSEVFPGIENATPGSVMLGGPIVTAGGLVFIGATMDRRFHALSTETGQELWSADLPASAQRAEYR